LKFRCGQLGRLRFPAFFSRIDGEQRLTKVCAKVQQEIDLTAGGLRETEK
jgi:hypothetical protein